MSQTVTLGGDRIGSGKKMKQELHDYGMTSFNLEQDFKSSLAPGVLYPFLKLLGTNHDTFDIDLDSFVRTLPTQGPLFGSFKLQADLYACPIRLYQGILHNNPVGIGLKMNQVHLPKLKFITIDGLNAPKAEGSNDYNCQVNESALEKYFGISGAGHIEDYEDETSDVIRKFQCVPELAYYDIFKCYYANKQEEKAYVIGISEEPSETSAVTEFSITAVPGWKDQYVEIQIPDPDTSVYGLLVNPAGSDNEWPDAPDVYKMKVALRIIGTNLEHESPSVLWTWTTDMETVNAYGSYTPAGGFTINPFTYLGKSQLFPGFPGFNVDIEGLRQAIRDKQLQEELDTSDWNITKYQFQVLSGPPSIIAWKRGIKQVELVPFDLKNIDTMRNRLLSNNQLGQEFVIDERTNLLPYSALVNRTSEGITWNAYPMNGLVVKTYQSDLFNNWLDSEFIDGESGISNITAVAVTDGKFLLDSVNFAEKMYNLLNRVLVSGGTYQDWQEARWGEGATRMAESPIFIGGMSAEVMFEEVISNSETNIEGDKQPLGSLAGKGTQVGRNGGNHIHFKCDEPTYIIGILSLTPRICYSQGNDWDRTELSTLDDLHAPEMDGIGFQDLMVEQMAWWDTQLDSNGAITTRHSAGKQTAWINYQTAIDKCYGDFAMQDGYSFMVLNRNYTMSDDHMHVDDVTTYIDPAKYNYAFAVTDLTAQNFWVQLHSKIVARRKMGAQQIPTM